VIAERAYAPASDPNSRLEGLLRGVSVIRHGDSAARYREATMHAGKNACAFASGATVQLNL
jgi:hypothetical protein